jgi:hypothetical protein
MPNFSVFYLFSGFLLLRGRAQGPKGTALNFLSQRNNQDQFCQQVFYLEAEENNEFHVWM